MLFLKNNKTPSIEEQYINLSNCGIRLNEGISLDRINEFEFSEYGSQPYILLLIALGTYLHGTDGKQWASSDMWHFDTECIYGHGDYVQIVRRLINLSKNDLKLDELQDYVDIDEGVAYLEFIHEGQRYHWDLKVEDDWVDPSIFSKYVNLLSKVRSQGKFTYYNLRGQDCLIGYCTERDFKRLTKTTKLNFEYLY